MSVEANPHQDTAHEHHHPSLKTYFIIFGALMLGLVLTVVAAFLPHWGALSLIIAMAIAVAKATLVVLYFMHLRYSSRLINVVLVATLLFVAIMFVFTAADYVTRSWLPSSAGWRVSPLDVPVQTTPSAPDPYPAKPGEHGHSS